MAQTDQTAGTSRGVNRTSSNLSPSRADILEGVAAKLGRDFPRSLDAEASTLGACLYGSQHVQLVADMLGDIYRPFYSEAHQLTWDAIAAQHSRGDAGDIVSLSNELKGRGHLERVGGLLFLSNLQMTTPSPGALPTHARIVTERAIQRQTMLVLLDSMDKMAQPGADAFRELDRAKERLFSIPVAHLGATHSDGVKDRSKILARVMEQALDSSKIPVIRTGIDHLDRAFGGWRKGELIVMAGRPGSGKTALATTCSMNAAGLGLAANPKPARVVLFEYEMAERQIWNRVLGNLARLDVSKFDEPENRWMPAEERAIIDAVSRIEQSGLFIDTIAGHSINGFRRRCEELVSRHGVQMFVIDQSNKIRGEKGRSRTEEVEGVYVALKQLAKDLDVPIISLSQLNRQCEQRNPAYPIPQLSDLRESGGVEQEADLVLMTFRPEDYGIPTFDDGQDAMGRGDILIEKHRNGSKSLVRLAYINWLARWESIQNAVAYNRNI
jgi:replicative DNA helicase